MNSNKSNSDGLKTIFLTQVRTKFQITIPVNARNQLGIEVGDFIEVKVDGESLILTPKVIQNKNKSDNSLLNKRLQEMEKKFEALLKMKQNYQPHSQPDNIPNRNNNRPNNRPTQRHENIEH